MRGLRWQDSACGRTSMEGLMAQVAEPVPGLWGGGGPRARVPGLVSPSEPSGALREWQLGSVPQTHRIRLSWGDALADGRWAMGGRLVRRGDAPATWAPWKGGRGEGLRLAGPGSAGRRGVCPSVGAPS